MYLRLEPAVLKSAFLQKPVIIVKKQRDDSGETATVPVPLKLKY